MKETKAERQREKEMLKMLAAKKTNDMELNRFESNEIMAIAMATTKVLFTIMVPFFLGMSLVSIV